jgi:hypothetical protein
METIKRDIGILMDYKASKEKQQIKYPLDVDSVEIRQSNFGKTKDLNFGGRILKEGLIVRTQKSLYSPFLFGDLISLGLGVQWKNQRRVVRAMRAVYPFTADPVTDVLSSPHPVTNGQQISVSSTGSLPSPLDTITYYTVTNTTGTTFKLSGIDILSAGSGTHYFSL